MLLARSLPAKSISDKFLTKSTRGERTNQNGFLDSGSLHFLVDHNLQHSMTAAARFVALRWFHCPVLVAAVEELHGFFNTAGRIPVDGN